MPRKQNRTGIQVRAAGRTPIWLTVKDVERFKRSYEVGDKINFRLTEHISLTDESTRQLVKAGRIAEIYPHVCRIRYWRKGEWRMVTVRWVDLALLEIEKGR